jgi:hypothetical protein
LIAKVKPIDVEITSHIVDPLGCVPTLPFGHLNAGWVKFLSDMTDEADEIWSFIYFNARSRGKYKFPVMS